MTSRTLVRLALVLPLVALAACHAGSGTTPASSTAPAPTGPVVARVGNTVITADEVRQKLGEQSPFLQAVFRDEKHKRQFVDNLVRFELLAQEASREGLQNKPRVQNAIKNVLVQELMRERFDAKPPALTDAQLKAYYDQHLAEFVSPERVRAAQIFIAAPANDRAARARAKQKIARLLQELKANELKASSTHPLHATYQPTLFSDLARKYSDDPATKADGGDMRYLSHDDLAAQSSKPFADAVFALDKASPFTGVVEEPQGFRIARLTAQQLAVNRTFDDPRVKETIKAQLTRQERTQSFDQFVEKLKKDAHVTVDDKVLATVEVPGPSLPPAAGLPRLMPPPVAPPPPVAGSRGTR